MKGLYLIIVFAIVMVVILAVTARESFTAEEQVVSSKLLDYINKQAASGKDDFSGYIDYLVSTGYSKQGLINLKSYYAMYDLASKGKLTQYEIVDRMN